MIDPEDTMLTMRPAVFAFWCAVALLLGALIGRMW